MAEKSIRATYHNGTLALIEPVDLPDGAEVIVRIDVPDTLTDADKRRRFLESAGTWADEYDWDEFLERTYRDRSLNTRPDVVL
ncbi:MAG: antitoxin family protein [Candidatus Poribacteria bacterium]|nr:antitoxin family protein [Candidatus Poribacteria bacterium]